MATAEALLTAEEFGRRADRAPQQFGPDDDLTVPDILGDFRVKLARFFE